MSFKGRLNAYRCPTCGRYTVTLQVDDGVTPMFLRCRAGNPRICSGRAASLGYPMTWPNDVPREHDWEWYRPARREWRAMDRETRAHVQAGGLLIRRRPKPRIMVSGV